MSYLIYAITGIIGGILMGLIGSGIGPIAVPSIAISLSWLGADKSVIMQIAIATSLTIIVLNTCFTSMFHKKNNNIDLSMYNKLLPGSLFGAIIGSILVVITPTYLLKHIFALILIIITCAHIFKRRNHRITCIPGASKLFLYAAFIAMMSNLIGVSDGLLMVPFLSRYNVNIKESIGTSTALVLPVSLIGLILFVIFGYKTISLPPYSIGYIYVPAVIIIAPLSIICSFYSIKVSRYLTDKVIKYVFCSVIVGVSLMLMFSV